MALPLRDDTATRRFPAMTWLLIGVCVFVFAFLQPPDFQRNFTGATDLNHGENVLFEYRWAGIPCEITHLERLDQHPHCDRRIPADFDEHGKNVWLSIIALMFLHGGLDHIAGNLLFLWVFGRAVENRLGPAGVLALCLVGGIVATLTFVVFNQGSTEPILGASGAIAAVMGAYLVLRPRGRILSFVYASNLQVLYLPAWAVLGFFFAEQFFTGPDEGVAWQAHVGGMVFGVVAGLVLRLVLPRLRDAGKPAGPDLAAVNVPDHH